MVKPSNPKPPTLNAKKGYGKAFTISVYWKELRIQSY
jgi:hypothetical protein